MECYHHVSYIPKLFCGFQHKEPHIWIDSFDCYSVLQDWDDDKKAAALPLFLTENAAVWFKALDDRNKVNYETIKSAFIKKYCTACYTTTTDWTNRYQEEGESVENFMTDMRRIFIRGGLPEENCALIVRERLLPAIRLQVVMCDPRTVDDVEYKARLMEHSLKTCAAEKNKQTLIKCVNKDNGLSQDNGSEEDYLRMEHQDHLRASQGRCDMFHSQYQPTYNNPSAPIEMPLSYPNSHQIYNQNSHQNSQSNYQNFYSNSQNSQNHFQNFQPVPTFNHNSQNPHPLNSHPTVFNHNMPSQYSQAQHVPQHPPNFSTQQHGTQNVHNYQQPPLPNSSMSHTQNPVVQLPQNNSTFHHRSTNHIQPQAANNPNNNRNTDNIQANNSSATSQPSTIISYSVEEIHPDDGEETDIPAHIVQTKAHNEVSKVQAQAPAQPNMPTTALSQAPAKAQQRASLPAQAQAQTQSNVPINVPSAAPTNAQQSASFSAHSQAPAQLNVPVTPQSCVATNAPAPNESSTSTTNMSPMTQAQQKPISQEANTQKQQKPLEEKYINKILQSTKYRGQFWYKVQLKDVRRPQWIVQDLLPQELIRAFHTTKTPRHRKEQQRKRAENNKKNM